MARARRAQTWQEMLMPCAQYNALEARHNARCEQGINSEKLTDNNNNAEEAENPQVDLTLVEARIHDNTINMFK